MGASSAGKAEDMEMRRLPAALWARRNLEWDLLSQSWGWVWTKPQRFGGRGAWKV